MRIHHEKQLGHKDKDNHNGCNLWYHCEQHPNQEVKTTHQASKWNPNETNKTKSPHMPSLFTSNRFPQPPQGLIYKRANPCPPKKFHPTQYLHPEGKYSRASQASHSSSTWSPPWITSHPSFPMHESSHPISALIHWEEGDKTFHPLARGSCYHAKRFEG